MADNFPMNPARSTSRFSGVTMSTTGTKSFSPARWSIEVRVLTTAPPGDATARATESEANTPSTVSETVHSPSTERVATRQSS